MREASELPQPSVVDRDPEELSELIDEVQHYHLEDLSVEAQPHAEADAELDAVVEDSYMDEETSEVDTPQDTTYEAYAEEAHDFGELYGVHQPPATDRDLDKTRDQESVRDANEGEHFFESLAKKETEYGPEAEHVVDVVDNSDEHTGHHSTEAGDRPVADKGSGGDAGL